MTYVDDTTLSAYFLRGLLIALFQVFSLTRAEADSVHPGAHSTEDLFHGRASDHTSRLFSGYSVGSLFDRSGGRSVAGYFEHLTKKQQSEEASGIRIAIQDKGPEVLELGRFVSGVQNGMVLNFIYEKWERKCGSAEKFWKICTRMTAVHEFGHAIRFSHEQNRPDTPETCGKSLSHTPDDLAVDSAGRTAFVISTGERTITRYASGRTEAIGTAEAREVQQAIEKIQSVPTKF